MKQRTIARLVGAVIAGMALTAGAATTTKAATIKAYPVTLTISPVAGQAAPKVSVEQFYRLQFAPNNSATISRADTEIIMKQTAVSAEGVCSINGQEATGRFTVVIKSAGACTINASISARDSTLTKNIQGSTQYTFQIPKADMSFAEFGTPLPATAVVGDVGLYASATSFNPIKSAPIPSITSLTPAVCSVEKQNSSGQDILYSKYSFKALAEGTCTISYSTPEADDFRAFSTTKSVTVAPAATPVAPTTPSATPVAPTTPAAPLVIGPQMSAQSVLFAPITSPVVGKSVTLNMTGGGSGNPILLHSNSPVVCTLNDNVLTAVEAGICYINTAQLGNDKYYTAQPEDIQLTIIDIDPTKTAQAITLGSMPSSLMVGGTATLTASGGDSGNAVTFRSQTPYKCTVESNRLTAEAEGGCIISVDQAGNGTYNPAPSVTLKVSITRAKPPQSITLNALPPSLQIGGTVSLTASGGGSGNAVTFSSLTPAVCTVEGALVTAIAAGACTVQANQAGNDQYADATPQSQTLTVQAATAPTSDPGTVPSGGSDPVKAPDVIAEVTPFSVNVSVAGDLTAQTVTASINPASSDAGKNGSEFLAAQLGEMVFLYGTGGWVQYTGADSVAALASGALASHELTLLDNVDMTPLVGAQIFVGYGLGNSLAEAYDEMQKASRMMSVYKVE